MDVFQTLGISALLILAWIILRALSEVPSAFHFDRRLDEMESKLELIDKYIEDNFTSLKSDIADIHKRLPSNTPDWTIESWRQRKQEREDSGLK
jgi:hypothetical protein